MRNSMLKIASLLLVVVMLSTVVVSGVFAKYITTAQTATGEVVSTLEWGVELIANPATPATAVEFAPGKTGTINSGSILVTGNPEVPGKITYTVDVTVTGWEANGYYCPLTFEVDGVAVDLTDVDSAATLEEALEAALAVDVFTFAAGALNEEASVALDWAWAFTGDDAKDTILGNAAVAADAPSITITLTAAAEQVQ